MQQSTIDRFFKPIKSPHSLHKIEKKSNDIEIIYESPKFKDTSKIKPTVRKKTIKMNGKFSNKKILKSNTKKSTSKLSLRKSAMKTEIKTDTFDLQEEFYENQEYNACSNYLQTQENLNDITNDIEIHHESIKNETTDDEMPKQLKKINLSTQNYSENRSIIKEEHDMETNERLSSQPSSSQAPQNNVPIKEDPLETIFTSSEIKNEFEQEEISNINYYPTISNESKSEIPHDFNLDHSTPKKHGTQSMNSPYKSPSSKSRKKNNNFSPKKLFNHELDQVNQNSSRTPTKELPTNNPNTPKFSPRSPIKKIIDYKRANNVSRNLYEEQIDQELITKAVENMNYINEGAIPPCNFDLEEIYTKGSFDLHYSKLNTKATKNYELKDLIKPVENYAKHAFTIIVTVLSNPINCGYFDQEELSLIYNILSMSARAQMLLVRLLKRKKTWFRVSALSYPEINDDLGRICKELVEQNLCTSKIENEDIGVLLDILQVDEIRKISQSLKVSSGGTKASMIEKLIKLPCKAVFLGAKSPRDALLLVIQNTLKDCVRLAPEFIILFDKILTLFKPNFDPEETISHIFFMLINVQIAEKIFPIKQELVNDLPLFKDRDHLNKYIEAKNCLCETYAAIEKKRWEDVKKFGLLALDHFQTDDEANYNLPQHIKRYLPKHAWAKVMIKSIDAFKKSPETMAQALEILEKLIQQKSYMQLRKGHLYNEMAKIYMHHLKNIDTAARLIIQGLNHELITDIDKIDLVDRGNRLFKRKGIPSELKLQLQDILNQFTPKFEPNVNEIEAVQKESNNSNKCKWFIDIGVDCKSYGRVEELALYHYYCQGYPSGIHCEGALPVTLFAILFWEEIYEIQVPGAFVSQYQTAPEDLFGQEFYQHRKKQIDSKLETVRSLDPETLSDIMFEKFCTYQHYNSLIHSNLMSKNEDVKFIVRALGVRGIAGICERLVQNYRLWHSGFPDLFVWNANTNKCKIVEVKGPGDSLSTKQLLWLEYIQQLGIDSEVCIVKKKGGLKRDRY